MGAAAAEIVLHAHNNLLARERGIFEQQRIGVHYHARSAEAALQGAVFGECFLKRMQFIALSQSLDSRNLFAVNLSDRHHAAANSALVDHNRTGTAQAHAAAVFRPCKSQIRT